MGTLRDNTCFAPSWSSIYRRWACVCQKTAPDLLYVLWFTDVGLPLTGKKDMFHKCFLLWFSAWFPLSCGLCSPVICNALSLGKPMCDLHGQLGNWVSHKNGCPGITRRASGERVTKLGRELPVMSATEGTMHHVCSWGTLESLEKWVLRGCREATCLSFGME